MESRNSTFSMSIDQVVVAAVDQLGDLVAQLRARCRRRSRRRRRRPCGPPPDGSRAKDPQSLPSVMRACSPRHRPVPSCSLLNHRLLDSVARRDRRRSLDTTRRGDRRMPLGDAGRAADRAPRAREDRLTHLEVLPPRTARSCAVARLGAPGRGRGVAAGRRTAAVGAPGAGGDLAHPGAHTVHGHRHGVGQVAGVPAPGPHRHRRLPAGRRVSAAPPCSTSPRRRRSPRTSWRRCARSRCPICAPPPTTATPPPRSASGPVTTRSTSSRTRTCCTARCCRGTSGGHASSPLWSTSSIDECHHYRGVFGAHVAQVHAAAAPGGALHGADPTFVLASATVAEPEVAAGG